MKGEGLRFLAPPDTCGGAHKSQTKHKNSWNRRWQWEKQGKWPFSFVSSLTGPIAFLNPVQQSSIRLLSHKQPSPKIGGDRSSGTKVPLGEEGKWTETRPMGPRRVLSAQFDPNQGQTTDQTLFPVPLYQWALGSRCLSVGPTLQPKNWSWEHHKKCNCEGTSKNLSNLLVFF